MRLSGTAQCSETLVQTVSKLNQLRVLDIVEYLSPAQIKTLMPCLPKLESLTFPGEDLDDGIWLSFCGLKLNHLDISGGCDFTAQPILDFISQLVSGNNGLQIFISANEPMENILDEEFDAIKDALGRKVAGTLRLSW